MESLIEQQRKYHEEIERLEQAIVKESIAMPRVHRERVNTEYKIRKMLERVSEKSADLLDLYEDKDGLRRMEISTMGGANDMGEFYSRLRQITDFHRRNPGQIAEFINVEIVEDRPTMLGEYVHNKEDHESALLEAAELEQERKINKIKHKEAVAAPELQDTMLAEFTDEESFGRALDLHGFYNQFLNLKGILIIDYLDYVENFDKFEGYPRGNKNQTYIKYLTELAEYLETFFRKSKPLFNLGKELAEVKSDFEAKWAGGNVPGWPKQSAGEEIDLSKYNSAEELEALGMDALKNGLIALDMKCGGALKQRAQRLFSVKGVPREAIDPALRAPKKKSEDDGKSTAWLETKIAAMMSMLEDVRLQTKENVERKLARTANELDDEDDAVVEIDSEPEEIEEAGPSNLKGLPLGWDGKPIPYWLYKLHGLNLSYSCEICANHVYKGPKAFQQHFQEWRHAHGMKCLKIPNTSHFANVTKIQDALTLWEQLKKKKESEVFKSATEEEYEDSAGNVVNKKTYEDLERQGLL